MLTLSNDSITTMLQKLKTVSDVKAEVDALAGSKDAHRVSHVLEVLMAGGLALKVSDIHIEPEQEIVRMRYRLDGVLMEVLQFDHPTYALVISRIKLLSGLKLNLKDIAQDGRFTINVNNSEIEIRSSILPGNYGESVVMRILDPHTIQLKLEDLGFDSYLLETFRREINKPNGMILNTGPTGSGKTTTLYAFLRTIYSPEIKIITIEDPIEYHLAGIVQTQVEKNYTFAQGLRSTLRQDPDVIMVGEIRDSEVASTAVQASLTGHLVFSTLHTNDAAGTFPRLIDMGVSPDILGSAVTLAMAQRLVRRLCVHCRQEIPVDAAAHALMDRHIAVMPHPEDMPESKEKMWKAAGCAECGNTGYRGRIGIVEAILMDREIENTIRSSPSDRDLWKAYWHQNIRTMQEDGIVKVFKGVTSLDELARVVDLSEGGLFRGSQ
jgi:type II secretory ATPase GspE/PulE/Tfp pilus assembly ATPase PilB-like protein